MATFSCGEPSLGAAKMLKFRRKNALENLLTPKSSNVTVGFDGLGQEEGSRAL